MKSFVILYLLEAVYHTQLVWCVNRKLLHQRVEGKEVSQEENFLPKHQRVKDLCQRAEYQTPCQQTGQVQKHISTPETTPLLLNVLHPLLTLIPDQCSLSPAALLLIPSLGGIVTSVTLLLILLLHLYF